MYELIILGQLSRRAMHGYLIAKIVGHIFGPYRQVQWGALYPVLNRLEREGLIRSETSPDPSEGRTRKVYAITPTGEARLHDLLMDTEHRLGEYDTVFAFKVALFHRLTVEERLRLARHYAVHAQSHIDHLDHKRRLLLSQDTPLTSEQKVDVLAVQEHGYQRWLLERAWAEQLIAQQQEPIQEAV